MPDMEKVIKGLETSLSIGICGKCVNECWYGDTIASCHNIIRDAITLLKALDVTPEELERLKKCRHECKIDCLLEHYDSIKAERDALLKAQEPRVMTLEEVKQERICWIEDADDGMTVRLFPATMIGIGEYANGSKSYVFLAQKPWAIDANDCEWWYLIEDYGETWRCWTSKPTDEQRMATPWKKEANS